MATQEEKHQKFQEYKFHEDSRWQHYYNNLFPIPNLQQLDMLKKKWFKKNVDGDFDPVWGTSSQNTQDQTNQNGQNQNEGTSTNEQQSQPNNDPQQPQPTTQNAQQTGTGSINIVGFNDRASFFQHKLYHIEGILKVIFLVLTFVTQFSNYAKMGCFAIGLITCYLGMTRQIGRIQINKDYLQKALVNEFGVTIFFLMSLVGVQTLTVFNWLPASLHFLIGATEFIIRGGYKILQNQSLLDFSEVVRNWKNEINVAKGYLELFSLFYYIVITLMGRFSILIIFIYGHYLKFRYKLNQYSKYAIDTTRSELKLKVAAIPVLGKLLDKVIHGLFYIITF